MRSRPNLLTLADVDRMEASTAAELLRSHQNPGQLRFLQLLGFDRVLIRRAEGMFYYDAEDRPILDFFGGFGSLALGHNHPRILAARRRFSEARRPEIQLAFPSPWAGALAKNLAQVAPGDLEIAWLGCTGSEAVEFALKLAERAAGPSRSTVAFAESAFHGKTRGALSVTDSVLCRADFRLSLQARRVPYGDAGALEQLFRADRSVGSLILEPVQGAAGVVVPPDGYLKEARRLCDQHEVILIADEVQCGFGRTGRFFAFEHEQIVPDVVTMAKSLGGGKASVAAVIARRPVYMKAYGASSTALIHGPATFSGMGEAAATAIEAMNVLFDENLIENAERVGAYLISELVRLRRKHPDAILGVRGRGLMVGLTLASAGALAFGSRAEWLRPDLEGSFAALLGALLLFEHRVLVAFTEYDRNVLRLEPPLIAEARHVETFVEALDDLLSRPLSRLVLDYAAKVQLTRGVHTTGQ
ncbi:MAG: aspartate aminotransferase family protein [Deltaproteobacteria bacterium]|nr:aspartate aminotransferase family protein [Deltaproteobacteria bacterium]